MAPPDRRHGYEVRARLAAAGHDNALLLQTALVHDVGKADAGISLVHRIARVGLSAWMPPAWAWLSGCPTGWRRPYWVLAHHPERGSVWVETVGGPPAMAALIRYHETDAPTAWSGTEIGCLHAYLAAADDAC
jgi:hypothetical protein